MNETIDPSRWLFAVSIVLNVFLLGGIAGGASWLLVSHSASSVAGPLPPDAPQRAARFLPPPQRDAFVETLRRARNDGDANRLLDARAAVLAAIAAPRFDPAALDAAMSRSRAADGSRRTHVEQSVAGFVATLSPDERRRLATGLRAVGPWRLSDAPRAPVVARATTP